MALLAAVLVAYARVYVGDHYPIDVVVGAADGVLGAVLFLTVLQILSSTAIAITERVLVLLHIYAPPAPRMRGTHLEQSRGRLDGDH